MTLLVLSCDVFFFKQKTAYEMRISDWSSDVCSSDLPVRPDRPQHGFGLELGQDHGLGAEIPGPQQHRIAADMAEGHHAQARIGARPAIPRQMPPRLIARKQVAVGRSEEHTSELQSLMRISYAVFCLKKKTNISHIRLY